MIATALLLVALAQTPHAPQRLEGEHTTTPEQEARALRLGKQIRCAVCQGLSITDSPASMARAQLDTVRSLIIDGKSDQEIYDYFVARYGEWALLAPPAHDLNLIVWLGPGLVLVLGAFVVFRLVRQKPAAPAAKATAALPGKAASDALPPGEKTEPEDPYLAAVRAELKK